MIRINILRDKRAIVGFAITGHSGFQVHGSDIVCAAVSALSQTAVLALEQVVHISPDWIRDEGLLKCNLPVGLESEKFEAGQVVLKTILLGIENIAEQYPEHVKVSYEEV